MSYQIRPDQKFCSDCFYENESHGFYMCANCWDTDIKPNFLPHITREDLLGIQNTQDLEYEIAELRKINDELIRNQSKLFSRIASLESELSLHIRFKHDVKYAYEYYKALTETQPPLMIKKR